MALVGKTYYPTLKDAIVAAEAGDTVTLLKDITVDMGDKDAAAIAITKNLTLDGNGKTIAANKIDAKEGMGHILGIQGANVKVRDLTLTVRTNPRDMVSRFMEKAARRHCTL